MDKEIISSTEGQIPEGIQLPLPEFPPQKLMIRGREYWLLGGSTPPGETQTRFNYFIPDPVEHGFSASWKNLGEDEVRGYMEDNKPKT